MLIVTRKLQLRNDTVTKVQMKSLKDIRPLSRMTMNSSKQLLAATFSALALSAAVLAQSGPTAGGSSGNTGLASVKSQIHATDEEWKVISPKLQLVITARQAVDYVLTDTQGNSGFAGFGGRGGPGGGFGPGGGDSFADPGAGGGFGPGGGGGRGGGGGGFGRGGPGGGDGFTDPGAGGFGRGGGGGFGRGGPGGGDGFADPGAGGFGRGGRGGGGGGFGRGGGFGPGGDSFGDPGAGGNFGPGGRGGPGGDFGPGFGASAGLTNAPGAIPNGGARNGPQGGGFPGGMGGGNNAVAAALDELKTTLSNTNAPTDLLTEKVEAVRTARKRAKADLDASEQNLRRILTVEQQAVLVSLGYLD